MDEQTARGKLLMAYLKLNPSHDDIRAFDAVLKDYFRAVGAASPAAGWRDIASAPQEGQDILVLYDSGEVVLVEADDFTEWKPYKSAGLRGVATPQYWMPVPAPPSPPSEEARAG